jgi:hypothetical protein
MEGKSDGEKASLYDEYIEAQRKKALTKKYEGKIPSFPFWGKTHCALKCNA